jgi:nucleotide-binding universal stress UspA family protein
MSSTTIVVGYDGSPDSEQALRWALDEAERTRAVVRLAYAWVRPNYLPAASMVPGTSMWTDAEHEAFVKRTLAEAVREAQDRHQI